MEISELVYRLIKERLINQCFTCEVVRVDKTTDTCDVRPFNDGPELLGVRLTATVEDKTTKAVFYPKVGSVVLVGIIDSIKTDAYVCALSEVEEIRINCNNITFNGGQLGGMIKIGELVSRLNRLEEQMFSHQHLSAPPGSPTAPDPATNKPLVKTLKSDLENDKIKH